MSLRKNFGRLSAIVALGGALLAGTQQSALAGSCDYPQASSARYETVVRYVTRVVPTTEWVVRYDDCGHPYRTQRTVYRAVRVPVERVVPVVY